MGNNNSKRQSIFNKFKLNLELAKKEPAIGEGTEATEGEYVCPICEGGFTEIDLDQKAKNPLTLEDVPPKSLGGKQIALTCEACNNGMGKDIDWHLSERLKELEFKDQKPLSEMTGRFELDGIIVNGKIKFDANGKSLNEYSIRNNNPKLLNAFKDKIKKGTMIKFQPKQTRVDAKKLQIALLKNAYLLMFERFGYAFIFNKQYDRIRKQLLNPTEDIYPLNCWLQGPFPKEHIGVSFITEKGLESIFVLFELKTKLASRIFAVILPLVDNEIESIINELKRRFEIEKSFSVQMEKYTDDYLTNMESTTKLVNWMKTINHS